jgi:flavin reductase (DIM6/NTAB) family NADH-FMN oxidoreductase RutF
MLAALDQGSRTLGSVQASGRFGVNVLPAGAEDLAVRFASKDPEPRKWEGIRWSEAEGSPRLESALVWIACELRDEHEGGDHVIVIGHVIAAEAREGAPLLFHRGAYRDLIAES